MNLAGKFGSVKDGSPGDREHIPLAQAPSQDFLLHGNNHSSTISIHFYEAALGDLKDGLCSR